MMSTSWYCDQQRKIISKMAQLGKGTGCLSMMVPLCGNDPIIILTNSEFKVKIEEYNEIQSLRGALDELAREFYLH